MIKLVLFDMDGTIVQYNHSSFQSSWDALGAAAGLGNEWAEYLEHYLHRPELHREWFEVQCKSLAGKEIAPLLPHIFPPPYTPGFQEFCQYLDENKIKKGLLSSGIDLVAQRIHEEVHFDMIFVNELHVQDGKFTGTGSNNISMLEKDRWVRRILEYHDIPAQQTAYFGDHFNDIPAWKEVGLPLGMNVKEERCHQAIQHHFNDFYQALGFFEKHYSSH